MSKVRIVIMGKTGVGKSTIVNSILGEEKAESGDGAAVTRENKVYECQKRVKTNKGIKDESIFLYDTVGLEVDSKITKDTLRKIKDHIKEAKKNSNDDDVNIVWFCINERTNRFEEYESELIKELSIQYEIPFVVVLTQCISKKNSNLVNEIKDKMPDVPIHRIMAADYSLDDDITIKAYGLDELITESINNYYSYRVRILESVIDSLTFASETKINSLKSKGKSLIFYYSEKVGKAGWIPVGCIPYVHSKCIQMVCELNSLAGLSKDKDFADEIFTDVILGVVATPLMAVPFISKFAAESYIETVGDNYLEALVEVVRTSSAAELKNKKYLKDKMRRQLESL